MKKLVFAKKLEQSIIDELSYLLQHCPAELYDGIEQCRKTHCELLILLNQAEIEFPQGISPVLDTSLVGVEASWQSINQNYGKQYKDSPFNLIVLWQIASLLEKTAQYYQQAGTNSALPNERYFYSSIAEIKKTLRRKTDALLSIATNKVWQDVGFSPSVFGRE